MTNYVECGMCHKKLIPGTLELAHWEMQHLHLSETKEIKFLTCGECKLLSPMEFLKVVEESKPTAPEGKNDERLS